MSVMGALTRAVFPRFIPSASGNWNLELEKARKVVVASAMAGYAASPSGVSGAIRGLRSRLGG
jgi:hypothetical protein